MDCRETQEHLGDAIDRDLPPAEKSAFFDHLQLCSPCRDEYETEIIGKHAVRRFIHHVKVPRSVYRAVVSTLDREIAAGDPAAAWWDRLFSTRFFAPALAGGIAVLAMILFLSRPQQAPDVFTPTPVATDMMGQIRQNFNLLRSGDLKPAMVSYQPEMVTGYFREHPVPFTVDVLSRQKCDWYGAIANEVSGVKLAHVVYKIGADLMYVYQVSRRDAMEGSALTMSPVAKASLESTGWYTDESPEGCSVVLWTSGETLCAAASTMNKERLLQLLAQR